MSSIDQMATALQTTLQNALGSGVYVYDAVPGQPTFPALIVEPAKADYNLAMGSGLDEWEFHVQVFASRAGEREGRKLINQFLNGFGPKSIRQIIAQNPTLGLSDSTAVCKGMRGYGGSTRSAGAGVVGGYVIVCIYTSGKS